MSLKKAKSHQHFLKNWKIMKRDLHKINNWHLGDCGQNTTNIIYSPVTAKQ